MKKNYLLALLFIGTSLFQAHGQDKKAFSGLGGSISLTTTGPEIELTAPLHQKLYVRGGFSVLPYNFIISLTPHSFNGQEIPDKEKVSDIDIDTKVRLLNGKLLVDYYPAKFPFFITGGVYMGAKKVIKLEGQSEYDLEWDDYVLPAENGRVKADIRTYGVKPYLGIGIGKAIPNKRVGFRFEIGAMFHGTPGIYNVNGEKLDNINVNKSDVSHTIHSIKAYPVVAFRLTGRII